MDTEPGALYGGQLDIQRPGLPGQAGEDPLQEDGQQKDGIRAHAERFRPGDEPPVCGIGGAVAAPGWLAGRPAGLEEVGGERGDNAVLMRAGFAPGAPLLRGQKFLYAKLPLACLVCAKLIGLKLPIQDHGLPKTAKLGAGTSLVVWDIGFKYLGM